jgi:hypothetical protein
MVFIILGVQVVSDIDGKDKKKNPQGSKPTKIEVSGEELIQMVS